MLFRHGTEARHGNLVSQGGWRGRVAAATLPRQPPQRRAKLLGAAGRRLPRQIRHEIRPVRGPPSCRWRSGKTRRSPRRWLRPRRSAPGVPGRPNHSPSCRPGSWTRTSTAGGARGEAAHHSPSTIAARWCPPQDLLDLRRFEEGDAESTVPGLFSPAVGRQVFEQQVDRLGLVLWRRWRRRSGRRFAGTGTGPQ